MTLMVRDEADIIKPMIDHHLSSGVDMIIATDNGSIDGTYEILESYGQAIDLRRDPLQHKQQFSVVTAMARDAARMYGADWVLNADADEFWVPANGASSLRGALNNVPASVRTFSVPVIDMTGAPAQRGSGLQRLTLRDTRPLSRIRELGLYAHSTPNAVHVGDPRIEVTQGNHSVNLAPMLTSSAPSPIEVLHLPWRSWEQFERKVRNAGVAYDSNPDLLPSPNHHGMRDYKRLQQGSLQTLYIYRHPDRFEVDCGLTNGTLHVDTRLADNLLSPIPDVDFDERQVASARLVAPILVRTEQTERELVTAHNSREAELLQYVDEGKQRIDGLIAELAESTERERRVRQYLRATVEGRFIRLVRAIMAMVRHK